MSPSLRALAIAAALGCGCAPDMGTTPVPPKQVVALFDPIGQAAASARVVPQPNDLDRDPSTGHPVLQEAAGTSAAQAELIAYLGSLDGFPPEAVARASFSGPIDPASLAPSNAQQPGSVAVIDLGAMQPLTADDYDVAAGDDKKSFVVTPHLPRGGRPASSTGTPAWALGHAYFVIAFGGPAGIRAADSKSELVASPAMFYLRQARPLLTKCDDGSPDLATAACLCPLDGDVFDSACHPEAGLTIAEAQQLEPMRRKLSALLDELLPISAPSATREDVVLAWFFTVAHGPFVPLDPSAGIDRLPFPNDLLLDGVGHVSLPADPNAKLAAITRSINSLDGFSTLASGTVPIDAADDNAGAPPLGAIAGQGVHLLNLTLASAPPVFSVGPEQTNGARDWDGLLAIQPTRPLRPDHTTYLGVATNAIKDAHGRPLRPSLAMRLATSAASLVDDDGHTTVTGMPWLPIDDTRAATLEVARQSLIKVGAFQILAQPDVSPSGPIDREDIAAVWTFTTQSTALATLADPNTFGRSTDVEIVDVQPPDPSLGPDTGALVFGRLKSHLALSLGGAPGSIFDGSGGTDVDVPFLLIAPAGVAAKGILVVQHGLGGWRGDARAIAEAAGKAGWAVIAIDMHFHGQRAACTSDAECDSGGTCKAGVCSTHLVVHCSKDDECAGGASGSCNTQAGVCASGFAPLSRLCMTHIESGVPTTECNPVASGSGLLQLSNPASVRDVLRQHVIDLSQLVRVLRADTPGSLVPRLAALNPRISVDNSRIAFLGTSIGATAGALFLAAVQQPIMGVLGGPGGRLAEAIAQSLSPLYTSLLQGFAVPLDSPASHRLDRELQWLLDPADPIAFARTLSPSRVMVQVYGRDATLPPSASDAFAAELGLPLVDGHAAVTAISRADPTSGAQALSTYFPTAVADALLSYDASAAAAQTQAIAFIDSDGTATWPPGK